MFIKIKEKIRSLFPNWVVNTFWHMPVAWMVAAWFGFPARKLTLIGVTGTDGKTTTVYLINHILKTAGKKTAMISSVVTEIDGKEYETGFHVTSPHPFDVQKYLQQAVDRGVEYAILEVTSHALDQHRFAGCNFDYGVLTNIRPDHLDYHKTFENYKNSKLKLINNAKIAKISNKNPITAKDIGLTKQPQNLPGEYNLSNILAAAAVALELEVDKKTIRQAIKSFPGVPGRFEEIKTGKNFRVIIDFAHTPYALRELLMTLRAQQPRTRTSSVRDRTGPLQHKRKIITVFGCAAERGKDRRKMGKVSAELADLTIITAEDPRFEGVAKISDEIAGWALKGGAEELEAGQGPAATTTHYFIRIPDRQEAINFAVRIARKSDIVVLCGKGHEQSMNIDGVEYPWSEHNAVTKALHNGFK